MFFLITVMLHVFKREKKGDHFVSNEENMFHPYLSYSYSIYPHENLILFHINARTFD